MNTLHLICNAHIDPVWQWDWEEGAAEAVSTFRIAADFAEQFEGFVFNHNEALLYRWIEEYEPPLFARIQTLVREGKWHIMGGWYLQPDCNLPSGESFVRQILLGRRYFFKKFGVEPRTAINFDPFGHSRGLVQILAKSGFDSYIFCRPVQKDCSLPSDDFWWEGFDGSKVKAHRSSEHYNSGLGKAREKVEAWLAEKGARSTGLLLWGVGNHGGGPSKIDLQQLGQLMGERTDWDIRHSTPDAYFNTVDTSDWPTHQGDLNAWAVGCYTSQVRIKQLHRRLENQLFLTEKMASAAGIQGLADYPSADFQEISRTLALTQFHDILPGSSVQTVEDYSLGLLGHGLELLTRLRARAFFALSSGQKPTQEGEIPILIYNPHPYPVSGFWECEFMLADQNWAETFTLPTVWREGTRLPSQCEKENSNLSLDWRKRVVFEAVLEPSSMSRFDVRLDVLPSRPRPEMPPSGNMWVFQGSRWRVTVSLKTGFLSCERDGQPVLSAEAGKLLVLDDDDDPWAMNVNSFRRVVGEFALLSPEEGSRVSGITGPVQPSVRIIEDGEVRTVVEAVFGYGNSFAVVHYKLPKGDAEIEVGLRVNWNEKSRMLKYSLPVALQGAFLGQTAFGVQELPSDGREVVSQKWLGVFGGQQALTVVNDGTYGSDYDGRELRFSLLRSAAYCAHPIHDRPLVPQDRYSTRIDQGERIFRYWIQAGPAEARKKTIEREALTHNEIPFALSFFPSGQGAPTMPAVTVSDPAVVVSAFKRSEDGGGYILRLFEPTGNPRQTEVCFPLAKYRTTVLLGRFEVKTLFWDERKKCLEECDLIERSHH